MFPLTCMQVNFESWSNWLLKLRLKVEVVIKDYISLIWQLHLSTIFTTAVERILTNNQLCILWCSSHRLAQSGTDIQIIFGPNRLLRLSPI